MDKATKISEKQPCAVDNKDLEVEKNRSQAITEIPAQSEPVDNQPIKQTTTDDSVDIVDITRGKVTRSSTLFSVGKIIFGNVLLGLAYAKWMVPHKVINGGVTSLAMVLNKWLLTDMTYLTNGLTGILLVACLLFLGKESFLKSIISSFSYLFFFTLFYHWNIQLVINLPIDFILSCVLISLGYYCCISENSSTVGMDVVALIIHKKQPKLPIAATIRNLNFLVLALGFFTYGLGSIALGILFSFCYSWLLARLLALHAAGKII